MMRLTKAKARSFTTVWFCLLILAVMAGVSCLAQTASAPRMETRVVSANPVDVEAALGLICKGVDITRSKTAAAAGAGGITGCRVCPEGTDFRNEIQSSWELHAVTTGRFTSTRDDNLILSGTGCDSHANNFGGSFIFTFKDGKAKLIRYDNGLITEQCHKFDSPDQRNFLVCRGGWSGQGLNSRNVFTASFAANGEETVDYLISTDDTTGTCDEDQSTIVQESAITGLKFTPKDSGEITGLTVTATLGSIPCSQAGKRIKAGKWAAAVKTYSIEFQFDGHHFKPTPVSLPAYYKFEKR